MIWIRGTSTSSRNLFSRSRKLLRSNTAHSTQQLLASFSESRLPERNQKLPSTSQVVICGGGTVGCSIVYHLAKNGWKDVTLLEQGSLSCGTTWHAASLLGGLKDFVSDTQLSRYGAELYSQLEEETGHGTGWKPCGSVLIGRTKDRVTHMKRQYSLARSIGMRCEFISPEEVAVKFAGIRIDDIKSALWFPDDGVGIGTDICYSLTKGASMHGATIIEGVKVESIQTKNNRVSSVVTDKGEISCEIFVNCAGQWAYELGKKSNPKVNIPLHSTEHFYVVTKPMENIDPMMPVLRDPDGFTYFREWNGGVLAGGFEPRGKPCFFDKIPDKFEFQLLPEDWDHFEVLMNEILHRFPSMEQAEIRQMVNGPESFTPDGHYCYGAVPEIENYYVACGMNSTGIVGAAGAGRVLAEWIENKRLKSCDLKALDIKRFSRHHNNKTYLRDIVAEILGQKYKLPYPLREIQTVRNMKCSPLHDILSSQGSSWSNVGGWERPEWFSRGDADPKGDNYTFGKPRWFDDVKIEVSACLNGVGVLDTSATLKLQISGDSALGLMKDLCSNDADVPVGTTFSTLFLNSDDGIEAFCNVYRVEENRFLVLDSIKQSTFTTHWIKARAKAFSDVKVEDITSTLSGLSLLGPVSDTVLQLLTQTPLDVENFPANTIKKIDVAYACDVLVSRGKDRWDLLMLPEYTRNVYLALMEKGEKHGIANIGHRALESIRVEKGIPAWTSELGGSVSVHQTGLQSLVDPSKISGFSKRDQSGEKRLVHLTLRNYDDDNFMWGNEPVLHEGITVGTTTSASYGYMKDNPVALAYVTLPNDELKGDFSVMIANRNYPVDVLTVNI